MSDRDSHVLPIHPLDGSRLPAMRVRELRVTDIRCTHKGCGAGPGERCETLDRRLHTHTERLDEFYALKDAGWQWQEVDPTDEGARKE